MLAQAVSYRLENWENGRRTGIRGTLTDLKHVETQLATLQLPKLPELPEPPKLMLLKAPGAETGSTAETDESDAAPHTEKRKRTRAQTVETELDDHENESNEEPANHPEKPRKRWKTGVSFATCPCKVDKKEAKNRLTQAKKNGLKDQKILVRNIEYLRPNRTTKMCYNHLRDFCTAVGLKTQVGNRKMLLFRVEFLWKKRYELGQMWTDKDTRDWFTLPLRGKVPEDRLGTLRCIPAERKKLSFNPAKVMKRYAGKKDAELWERDGTIVVRGAMDWLIQDPEIKELIHHEVHMYLHHRRIVGGRKNLGWLRSAYYTQIQQIARQDPVYYALVAATSGEMWQISYPYYMKATLPGGGIAFQHIDLNLHRYVECGRGARRVQTSCTLNQETDMNATMVVPGFHKHIKTWWKEVLARENLPRNVVDHSTNCLKTNDIYLSSDKKKYGNFIPAVCGPGDIRVSRAEIIHGSISNKEGKAETERWVVNPWFVAIQPDHETLDVQECGTWTTLGRAHRDLDVMVSTPS